MSFNGIFFKKKFNGFSDVLAKWTVGLTLAWSLTQTKIMKQFVLIQDLYQRIESVVQKATFWKIQNHALHIQIEGKIVKSNSPIKRLTHLCHCVFIIICWQIIILYVYIIMPKHLKWSILQGAPYVFERFSEAVLR